MPGSLETSDNDERPLGPLLELRDGRTMRATRRDASSEAQAQLEQDGTVVILTSRTLTRDELATIAAGLKPAPDTGPI